VLCVLALSTIALAQDGDFNNAVLEVRVINSVGRPIDQNIKMILRNDQIILSTFYTDKHGEFRMPNMTQGIYYLQVGANMDQYQPVEVRVELPRGQDVHINVTLLRKDESIKRTSTSGVVSAGELAKKAPTSARKEYDKSVKLSNQGKPQEAIACLQRAIAAYPDYTVALNALGVQYLRLRQMDEAAKFLNKAIEKSPVYFDPRFNLGLVKIEQKKYDEAIAQLNQAIVIDSSQPGAHLWLGFALLQTNDLAGAETELSKALIGSNSTFVAAHFYLAQVYVKRGDYAEASKALGVYLEKVPNGEYSEDARQLLKKLDTRSRPTP